MLLKTKQRGPANLERYRYVPCIGTFIMKLKNESSTIGLNFMYLLLKLTYEIRIWSS